MTITLCQQVVVHSEQHYKTIGYSPLVITPLPGSPSLRLIGRPRGGERRTKADSV